MDTNNYPQEWITLKDYEIMAYQPASNCNAANYNPNDVPTVDTYDYSAQTEQKAAYHSVQKALGQQLHINKQAASIQDYPIPEPHWSQQFKESTGMGSIGGAAFVNTVLTKSLQGEADRVRSQSDQLKNLLGQLQSVLFEPVPSSVCGSTEKDNPSTIEGNLRHAASTLSSAILTLENVLVKIGGR